MKQALLLGSAVAHFGVNRSRELGDFARLHLHAQLPFQSRARELAGLYPNLDCKVLSRKQMGKHSEHWVQLLSATAECRAASLKMIVLEQRGKPAAIPLY